jgi:hypothetical protein
MNQHSLEGSPVRARPAGDKESMVKTLLLAAARGTGAGVLRVVLALIAAVIVNGLGAAIVLGFSDELRGGGHGTAILFALFIGAPFFIAVGITGAMAYKQGLMGVLSRILETQAPALAGLGAKLLEKFLRSVNYQPGSPVSEALLGQWRKFLQLQEDLPRPLPFVLGTLASKVPFSDTITNVATTGTSLQEVARNAMDDMVERAIQAGFRPEASTLLGALGIQFALWVVLAAVLHYN